MRRPPLRVVGWAALTLVLVLVATLLWRGSDAAATSSTTSGQAAEPAGSPAAQLGEAWSAASRGSGSVVAGGRVLVREDTGVRLLDPGSGTEAWHYERANARLCDATSVDGLVVAVFRTTGRCNEIVALEAGTGRRAWYRTVGFRADVRLSSTDAVVLAWTPTGLATIDPSGNSIRWRFAAPGGCRIVDAAVGSAGVGVLQSCPGADAVQVRLLDGFGGEPRWSRDVTGVAVGPGAAPGTAPAAGSTPVRLAGVGPFVALLAGDTLQALAGADGAPLSTLPLPPSRSGPADEPVELGGDDATTLVSARGTVLALDAATGAPRWQAAATGLPAVGDPGAPDADRSVLVPEPGAFVRRDALTGAELGRSTVSDPVAPGGRTEVLGTVVVVATRSEVTAYG
ncbi:PQQ-binding-like beta-propeller repeat protein [Goekera deserti]|uniref:outer membrane protein assembly factor BamB family protein n=1 Tax=Goekera deserti TaxID=2497753 RepID=UPI001F1A91F5|nr:PQQ-binding-like beta-propeller repeat protein [Goekera deserti]